MDLILQTESEEEDPTPTTQSTKPLLEITADGSAGPNGGAGAAIIRFRNSTSVFRLKVVAKFSCTQGSAAELGAILLGIAGAKVIAELHELSWPRTITICSDNKGVLGGLLTKAAASRTENAQHPIKVAHCGLWLSLSSLTKDSVLHPHYRRSAGTNRDQNNCDYAARWVLRDGERLLSKHGQGPVGRNAKQLCDDAWLLVDSSALHESAEESSGAESNAERLVKSLRSLPIDKCIKRIRIENGIGNEG